MRIIYNESKSIFKSNFFKYRFIEINRSLCFVFGIIIYTFYIINTIKAYSKITGDMFIFSINLFINFVLMILIFIIFNFAYFIKHNSDFIPTNTTLIITVITFLPSVALLFLSI